MGIMLVQYRITMKIEFGNSLVVQWLGLGALTARGLGWIPGWGIKILQAVRCGQKKKEKKTEFTHPAIGTMSHI